MSWIEQIAVWVDDGNGWLLWLMNAGVFAGGLGCIELWRRTRATPISARLAAVSVLTAVATTLVASFFMLVAWYTEETDPPYDPVEHVKNNSGMMFLAAIGLAFALIGRVIHLMRAQRS